MSATIRPLALLGAFVAGWLAPRGAVLTPLIPWLVGFMLFVTFLGLDARKTTVRRSHFLIVILNLLIGTCGFKLVSATSSDQTLALAVFFAGMAPTATAAPAIACFLKKEAEYIATGLLMTTGAVMLALPTLIPWALGKSSAGGEFFAAFLSVAKSVALTMVLPITLAQIWRVVRPSSRTWPKRWKNVTFATWTLMVTIIACRASAFIRNPANGVGASILLRVGAASLVVCALNFIVGYWIGEKNYRGESSQTLGQKNTGAMIVFASLYAEPLVALGPTIYVLWHNLWNAAQLARVSALERKESEAAETSTTSDAQ